jgi:pimeloyl-ACP methyl ester carboxylesterase
MTTSLKDLEEPLMAPAKERILVVHGLFRTHRAMRPLHAPLEKAGYEVLEYRYPSTRKEIDVLAEELRSHLHTLVQQQPAVRVHVIGHSLGAILSVRATTPAIAGIDKVIQISPPNQGSPVAKSFEGILGDWVAPIKELSSRGGGPLPEGTTPGTSTGIIAAADDVMVPIDCTDLDGATDRIILPGSHTFVFWRKRTQQEILHFLLHGRFSADAPRP